MLLEQIIKFHLITFHKKQNYIVFYIFADTQLRCRQIILNSTEFSVMAVFQVVLSLISLFCGSKNTCLDDVRFLIAVEAKKTPSYLQMKLRVNYTHISFMFFFRYLFLTFRFLFGNRLRNIPHRAFYNVYTDRAGGEEGDDRQIM